MRGGSLLLGIACLLAAAPSVAGALYRCDMPDGTRSYVNKKPSGAHCIVVSQSGGAEHRSASAPKAKASAASAAAIGSTVPVNAVAGSPVAIQSAAPAGLAAVPAAMNVPAVATPAPAAMSPASSTAPRVIRGQVYSYIKDGVRHYTSQAPRGVANASAVRTIRYSYIESCYACGARPGVNFGTVRLNTDAYRNEIAAAARQHGVDESIVRAIIHAESAYNPNALSRVGAQGLMQLMPATARRFGVSNAFDASQNIQGGVQYLAWLLKRFNNNLTLAAAGYNAGEGAVDKYKGVPPYSETQRYVVRVAQLAERYRGAGSVVR
ncbi:lytic transglycosylase domain-containing protein [Lysobacter sp. S4-A87]|uniref:lytic transglycosylase domain-containing protein n=1 Tax=Lysobacter sp. S4-A87 TaxID=2925843 RepID=UPI001F533B25|nr:lytic transglycosylase domain-containing protein [Lysobacter sp. S4-A87]UNK50615.1 lytic transglycosylase domain-containing protein [Lysobacter sp. S4-A87]